MNIFKKLFGGGSDKPFKSMRQNELRQKLRLKYQTKRLDIQTFKDLSFELDSLYQSEKDINYKYKIIYSKFGVFDDFIGRIQNYQHYKLIYCIKSELTWIQRKYVELKIDNYKNNTATLQNEISKKIEHTLESVRDYVAQFDKIERENLNYSLSIVVKCMVILKTYERIVQKELKKYTKIASLSEDKEDRKANERELAKDDLLSLTPETILQIDDDELEDDSDTENAAIPDEFNQFFGIKYRDRIDKLYEIFGEPDELHDDYPRDHAKAIYNLENGYEFLGVIFHKYNHEIESIEVTLPNSEEDETKPSILEFELFYKKINSLKQQDSIVSLLGMKNVEIRAKYESYLFKGDEEAFTIEDEKNKEVQFYCWEVEDFVCTGIEIRWWKFYHKEYKEEDVWSSFIDNYSEICNKYNLPDKNLTKSQIRVNIEAQHSFCETIIRTSNNYVNFALCQAISFTTPYLVDWQDIDKKRLESFPVIINLLLKGATYLEPYHNGATYIEYQKNHDPLFHAIKNHEEIKNNLPIIEFLLKIGANPQRYFHGSYGKEENLLHYSVHQLSLGYDFNPLIKLLVGFGVNPDDVTTEGITPKKIATEYLNHNKNNVGMLCKEAIKILEKPV